MRSIDQLQSLFDEILQQILESIVLVALSLVRVSVFVLEVLWWVFIRYTTLWYAIWPVFSLTAVASLSSPQSKSTEQKVKDQQAAHEKNTEINDVRKIYWDSFGNLRVGK